LLPITMYLYGAETVWLPGVITKIQCTKALSFKPYSMIIMIAGGVRWRQRHTDRIDLRRVIRK